MNRGRKEMLAAFFLGLLLPRIILNVAGQLQAGGESAGNQPTQAWMEETQQTVTEGAGTSETPVYIPVLTGAGDITVMELENYVRGVVLAEMPASFEEDALKAQAVVARTYALRRQSLEDRHPGGAVCTDSSCCQAYMRDEEYLAQRGTQDDLMKIARAAAETCGLVLTYDGELIDATYFSCSGGRTEDAVAVWGTEIPYLRSVESPGEEKAAAYREEVSISAEEFSARLGRALQGTPESWLGRVTYTAGGGVDTMYIGGICYTGTQLRILLGLSSTAFSLTAEAGGITVQTQGHGHRVGMSQYGADAMAASGSIWTEILSYYYHGTRIDKISDLG